MMNGLEQSDLAIVPMRAANKGTSVPAEPTEGRAGTKGNPRGQSTHRTQRRARVTQAAERIRQAATRKPKEKLTALLHHITTEALDAAYFSLKKEAAAGVDGVTWHEYGKGLAERLSDLHDRVQSGAYRARPSRRVEIPKPDGGTRPLGIAAVEDKIVQKAVAETILLPIYEPEFLGFSYGFRPGRGAHDALDALAFGIERRGVRWIVDADIRSYFDRIDRDWLVRFLEHRIGDRRVIRLIVKWLNAGVMEGGKAAKRFLGKALRGLKEWEQPEALNTDKAPAYAAAIAELKAEGKCPKDTRHRQVKYLNNVVEADHGKLKLLIRPVRGFKTLKTAYATIKGFEVMRALRKGQAGMFALQGGIVGEARIVERAFALGPCALTEAMALLQDRLANAET